MRPSFRSPAWRPAIPPSSRPFPRTGALLVLTAAILLPACGSGSGGGAPTPLAIEVSGKGREVKVAAPQSIKGGLVRIDLKNASDGPRDAQLIRVEGDHKPEEFVKLLERQGGPIPDWVQDGGGVGTTPPGQTGSAVQNLTEGNYFVASIPEGEQPPATAEFAVEAGSDGDLPKTTGEIIAKDYSFEAKGLVAGKNMVLFKNEGQELHHVVGGPIMPGKTLDDVKKFASEEGEPSGPPPIDFEKGISTAVTDGGIEQAVNLNLKKGKYALLCFITDRKGGPPHVMKGMISEVEVK